MLQGIIIFESGEAQLIGQIQNYDPILTSMRQLINQLEDAQRRNMLARYSEEQLQQMLQEKQQKSREAE